MGYDIRQRMGPAPGGYVASGPAPAAGYTPSTEEFVTNGGFTNNCEGWTRGTGWLQTDGQAMFTGDPAGGKISQTLRLNLVSGRAYTIAVHNGGNYVSGSRAYLDAYLGTDTVQVCDDTWADASKSVTLTYTGPSGPAVFAMGISGSFSIAQWEILTVSVKEA